MSLNLLKRSLGKLLQTPAITSNVTQTRNVIYYDRNTGRRHNDKDALIRFYRLGWGGWIRTRAGRHNHLWKKPWYIRWYARQHVLCTEEMCEQLEQMITPEVKKHRHFIDDPYAPYHQRHGIDCVPFGKTQTQKSYIKTQFDY